MTTARDGVAIVGMAGRFPGAGDLAEYWSNLRDGVESILPLTDEELAAAGVPHEIFEQPNYVKAAPAFAGSDLFDAEFFGYTAREAEVMDPQHRLFLETAWEALEHSGHDAARYDGSIGVFGGAGANRYVQHVYSHQHIVDTLGQTQILVANELGFLASRVSYKLDLKGPAVSLRAACSTALVAAHTACRSLLAGECDLALAGGVHVDPNPGTGYLHQDGSFVSPDGHVRPFDADARGTVFGTGVGLVVLKRLEDALADGDTVHAVIRGSAINNDGGVKVGFTAPSITGQTAVISAALTSAGLTPEDIDYVEAHGTGTSLGDPIEVQALSRAFGGTGSCALGSVKGNIGHLDAAAGIAGLLKTTLALKHELLPPSLNYTRGNPDIDFANSPFRVQAEPSPWPRTENHIRRAGISAFGFGGSNAHLILEEAPHTPPSPASTRPTETLILSARTPKALEEATDRLAAHLRREQPNLADAAHTLATGRRVFPHRRTVTGNTPDTIATALETRDPAHVTTNHTTREAPPLIYIFSGQGSQHPGMAHDLYQQEPAFRSCVDECAELLQPHLGEDIRNIIFTPDPRLDQTQWAQPALFVIEYALTQLWHSWDITPTAMLGHSLGEWTAACLAGVFTLPDALRLVALRGRLMQAQTPGAMLNIMADRPTIEASLPDNLSLAAHNGPRDCVVSGTHEAIQTFTTLAEQHGWATQPVTTSHAFHSHLMEPMIAEFTTAIAATTRHTPHTPFISNLTGTWITDEQATDPTYWGHHIRATVEYAHGITTATTEPGTTLLEIGPGQTLTSLARRILTNNATQATTLTSLPHKRDTRTPNETIQRTLSHLWLTGTTPNWNTYQTQQQRRRIPLPTYPFQHKHYWLDRQATTTRAVGSATTRRDDITQWFYAPSWQRAPLPAGEQPDHTRHWLVFADGLGVGEAVAERLRAAGATVTVVAAADAWSDRGDGRYAIDPANSSDYERLISTLRNSPAGTPTRIVHGWSVTAPGEEGSLQRGFESLIRLTQALVQHPDSEPRRIWVLSNGLHNVTGAEPLSPLKATLLGPCRVLPRELPGTTCRSVDLDCLTAPTETELTRLLAELAAEPEQGPETVAHRGGHRWSQHFLPQPLPRGDRSPVVRKGGVYLVTGGTGGLGLALAGHLAAAGARIALTARTRLPDAAEWDSWLARNPGRGRIADVVRKLVRLRDAGAELLVLQADVSDRAAMSEAVRQTTQRWGRIHGAFHTAGVAGGGLIQLKDLRAAAEVLLPKVRGTLVLEEALADQELDFLVLFGSNGANVGSAGQVDYCAANCFLDAFAQDRGRTRRVVSIDWGPWREIGMAAGTATSSGIDQADQRAMSAAEGLWALDTILAGVSEAQVIVSPAELSALFENAFSVEQGATAEPRGAAHERPNILTEFVAPRTDTERTICEVWQELLGIEKVGVQDSFFDLGGNSLIAIQLVSTINTRLDAKLALGDLYEGLTASHLATLTEKPVQQTTGDSRKALEERREKLQQRRRQHQQRRRTARGE
ncbi:Phthiocerol synthesis polyketide synthase type I PpsE [Streptomyces sp. ADI95-16]|uniref:type I polyketide synthase n=1 Tax=Streptomyces sp. ADI95-16 TaxID=1522758 RepID=UPI000F42D63A|nr:type I polyketide synthase [Streptomyces sp. ADI95-16]AYV31132.1 Phthiocerol synthesis polyketide synthase type I PpsE [Streptomyces sp. ADI95-16]